MATADRPRPIDLLPLVQTMEECCPQLFTAPLSEADAAVAAQVFKALGDPARVRLLSMIATAGSDGVCVCDVTAPIGLSQPTVSHHLKVLHDAGLLARERRASWVFYRLRPESLRVITRALGA